MPFVRELFEKARARLILVPEDTTILDVARLLHAGTDIVVLRDSSGSLAGVLTKTDIVELLVLSERLEGSATAASVMKQDVLECRMGDDIHGLWLQMHASGIKNVPIVDEGRQPIGILNARDALENLLEDTEKEETLLRHYVMGLGYR
ncbi:signal-transduction protein with cAMP-binding, CBS, and nucleotidyltransferase domain [Ensifer adhaerens]|uniref:Signal-transduction protein with cAMP-binding, CBS, and nucleotidyltransferase domain n=1 Tax=Ensifer adhaerens TaxID=106592 RepID=A0ACC5T2F5_ENSAD|nr:CBS domain-containing protein [Ensifer adhaerens]MBP1874829.1 signal-transduction protein with cAMP-binding, CBS, and nucleotidyltransferase domain [Ensifer adhaerens]